MSTRCSLKWAVWVWNQLFPPPPEKHPRSLITFILGDRPVWQVASCGWRHWNTEWWAILLPATFSFSFPFRRKKNKKRNDLQLLYQSESIPRTVSVQPTTPRTKHIVTMNVFCCPLCSCVSLVANVRVKRGRNQDEWPSIFLFCSGLCTGQNKKIDTICLGNHHMSDQAYFPQCFWS